jgi:hypothetical protein
MPDTRQSPLGHRRKINPLAAGIAATALIAGLLIAAHTAQQQAMAREASSAPAPSPPVAPSTAPSSAPVQNRAAGVAPAPVSVQYSFDGGARLPVLDGSAGHPLAVRTANGGSISYVARAGGWAVRFPPRCTTPAKTCPRAILQGIRDDSLNPGLRPLRYGASVLMTRTDTADGANVVQKGYSLGGITQYKLQVDHAAGTPSCVIASASTIYRAESHVTVADGSWHNLVCNRTAGTLTLHVDGVLRATRKVPAALSIANTEPLRVGGKGTTVNNDQFAGQIDNVFVTIG